MRVGVCRGIGCRGGMSIQALCHRRSASEACRGLSPVPMHQQNLLKCLSYAWLRLHCKCHNSIISRKVLTFVGDAAFRKCNTNSCRVNAPGHSQIMTCQESSACGGAVRDHDGHEPQFRASSSNAPRPVTLHSRMGISQLIAASIV